MIDRKEALCAYKQTATPMGVCRILDQANGRSFLIASVNTPAMLNRQRFQLEMGGHPCAELQNDWNRHGSEAFSFEVVDALEPSDDPDYDPSDDLDALVSLWRARLDEQGVVCYPAVGARRGAR